MIIKHKDQNIKTIYRCQGEVGTGLPTETPPNPKQWDVMFVIPEERFFFFDNGEWKSQMACENDVAEKMAMGLYPTNCKNCGAVLHGHKCEYCGTEYR